MSYSPQQLQTMEDFVPPPVVLPVPGTTALAQAQTSSGWGKKLFVLLLVVVGALILLVLLDSLLSKKKRVVRNPVKRLSTPELAKQLYERLERRGDANPATMRSLAAYTRGGSR